MVVIGLIGPVAAGKSVVLSEFKRLGAVGIRADEVSRRLLTPGSALLAKVIEEFGEQYLLPSGELDRRALGELVFGDAVARERLERLIHPAMVAYLRQWVEQQSRRCPQPPAVVIEAANLVEMGGLDLVDVTVQVTAPAQMRVQRLMARDGVSERYARSLVALHEELGIGHFNADYEISTAGDLEETRRAVERLWGELVKS